MPWKTGAHLFSPAPIWSTSFQVSIISKGNANGMAQAESLMSNVLPHHLREILVPKSTQNRVSPSTTQPDPPGRPPHIKTRHAVTTKTAANPTIPSPTTAALGAADTWKMLGWTVEFL